MLLRTYLNICLLRANPQDLPASRNVLAVSLFAYLSANLVTFNDTVSLPRALAASVADTLLLVGLACGALLIRGLLQRRWQVLAALAGCGAFISVVAWLTTSAALKFVAPEFSTAEPSLMRELTPGQTQIVLVVSLLCIAWFILVLGHIFREALNVPMAGGVALAMLYTFASTGIGAAFIGGVPQSNG